MTEQESKQIFVRICKKCNRKFESLSESQINNNFKIHEMNCRGPKKKKT